MNGAEQQVLTDAQKTIKQVEASRRRTAAIGEADRDNARVFGGSLLGSLGNYDPATSSLRTSQLSLLEDSTSCLATLPRAGSMRSGTIYQRRPLAPLTGGTGSGSWPTPKVTTNRTSRESITRDGHWSAPGLEQMVELAEGIIPREVGSVEDIASPQARARFPTPTSNDHLPRRSWKRQESLVALALLVARSQADGGHYNSAASGSLNPTWVEWLMGYPSEWTALEPSATRLSPRSPSGSENA